MQTIYKYHEAFKSWYVSDDGGLSWYVVKGKGKS